MLMSYEEFTYLYNLSSEEVKNRVLEILAEPQLQNESPEKIEHTMSTVL